ncbi:hypothetical protein OG596_11145 [Streptomyces sp. NBC_01102]|uniref:hypothetical protein n=1 Tax=unclassified Streptomyces TaxID=2593676 RepID=UPI0038633924|nr:hypothetical protein OG596_11145 [Streptomyces sp. NBC_01102]
MYEYEMHRLGATELIRLADEQRTVRQAVLARRAARRSASRAGRDDTEGRVSGDPDRFAHAA